MVKNRLKLARVREGDLTQEELAGKIGCSRQTIHSIESEKYLPSVELALKLALVLKTKVDELFYIEDKKNAKSG